MKRYFLWIAVVVLALALVGQYALYANNAPPKNVVTKAVWAFQPNSFSDVVNQATTAVEAEVVSVAAGPDLVSKVSGEPGGEAHLPTQRITMKVISSQKGPSGVGQEIVMFRTGTQEANGLAAPPATGDQTAKGAPNQSAAQHIEGVDDDPPYQVGEKYYLLAEDGLPGTIRPVSPEGRYRINADGTVAAVTDTAVAAGVNGRSLETVKQAVEGKTTLPNGSK